MKNGLTMLECNAVPNKHITALHFKDVSVGGMKVYASIYHMDRKSKPLEENQPNPFKNSFF